MSQTSHPSFDRRTSPPTTLGVAEDRRASDRRSRARLRELCDEVLASYRAAHGESPLTDADRAVAAELLPQVVPLKH
ncbi:MAG TPA: hypothetical protein VFX39_04455 [Gemmatimonadaceae bacterium]|nr:hypothetical protein [Gemmatimonadaceae bacterium]